MKRILFVLVFLGISINCFAFSTEFPNKLFVVDGKNNLCLFDTKTKERREILKIWNDNYDFYDNHIIYVSLGGNNKFYLRLYELNTGIDTMVGEYEGTSNLHNLEWINGRDFLVSKIQNNVLQRCMIDTVTKELKVVSFHDINGNSVYKKYFNSEKNLYLVQSYSGDNRGYIEVYENDKRIYQSKTRQAREAKFINENEISFLEEGNIYDYNLKTQRLNKFSDFPDSQWDAFDINGYEEYSWSSNKFLAITYSSKDTSVEVRILSPEGKLITRIPNAYSPKWIEKGHDLDLTSSGITVPATLGNSLTSDYAKYYHQFPGGKELSVEEKQQQISVANLLSDEGFALYKAHNDIVAIGKYEVALTHYASADIYYRYGNSLSNISSRLEDAIKAYQIALELNYDQSYLVYYNIACVYSRMKNSKDAFTNLESAINKGYKNFSYIEKDPDLAWLRSQPEWKNWWAKHKQNNE